MKNRLWLVLGLIFVVSSIVVAQTAKRTITNDDLEKFKQKRVQAEAEYRANYKKLGMPSPEDLEQRNAEDQRWREEFSRKSQVERQQNQDNWQVRANSLRNEIYNVNAQINYLNNQIANQPNQNQIFVSPGQLSSIGYAPYGYGQPQFYQPQTVIRPIDNVQTVINASAANPNPFYGTPLYSSGIKLVIGQNNQNYRRRGYGRNYGNGSYYAPYIANNNSSQSEELTTRLQHLGQVRAGLFAQWDNLVNEARRAGVRITF